MPTKDQGEISSRRFSKIARALLQELLFAFENSLVAKLRTKSAKVFGVWRKGLAGQIGRRQKQQKEYGKY